MKRVAEFLHSVGKVVVARATDPRWLPRIGAPLFDEKGRKVGVVADIIGPVERPYVVVKGEKVPVYFTERKFLVRGEIYG